jgi:DNA-binding beta-propeller fold protein YncE
MVVVDMAGTQFPLPFILSALTHSPLGNVYIADWFNNRIRKVTISTGIITTIAGSSSVGYSGDNGVATSAALYGPEGVALDASGTHDRRTAIMSPS